MWSPRGSLSLSSSLSALLIRRFPSFSTPALKRPPVDRKHVGRFSSSLRAFSDPKQDQAGPLAAGTSESGMSCFRAQFSFMPLLPLFCELLPLPGFGGLFLTLFLLDVLFPHPLWNPVMTFLLDNFPIPVILLRRKILTICYWYAPPLPVFGPIRCLSWILDFGAPSCFPQ